MAGLEGVDILVMDLDGVVWVGSRILEANIKALKRLQDFYEVYYVTNNSTGSRVDYASKLSSLGLKAGVDHVITSGRAAALWLKRHTNISKVYIIGENGLLWELEAEGYKIVDKGVEAEAVVVGLDRKLTYDKLVEALAALQRNAYFIATNLDHILPTEERPIPGAGAIIAALRTASGREPDVVAGKPNPWILKSVIGEVDYTRVAVVGDRIDTDIELALRVGAKPILVSTGISSDISSGMRRELSERGVLIVDSLKELLH